MQIEHPGFAPHVVDYDEAWQLQREVHAQVVAGERPNVTLLLEHPAVYTAGKLTEDHERPQDGTPVIDVDRGGKITWHGPGQLVGYPIVALQRKLDVVGHVRRIEEMLIGVCADLGLETTRVKGRSGVWLTRGGLERKIAQIGIRVSQNVTMHGFSLNVNCDLGWTETIVPCGIDDAEVTTLVRELGRDITIQDVLPYVEKRLPDIVG